jgi:mRNA interferase MazF
VRRGEVWWVVLSRPVGRRPAVILTRDAVLDRRTSVTVALVTGTIRGNDTEVIIDQRDGMPRRSAINLDNLVTIPAVSFDQRITLLSSERMNQVREALFIALDLKERAQANQPPH